METVYGHTPNQVLGLSGVNHNSLNARQWKDIRQAARLACSKGVFIVMHGVKLSSHNSNLSRERDNWPIQPTTRSPREEE